MNDYVRIIGAILAGFLLTLICLKILPFEKTLLGHDRGRKYAVGSEVNKGKPTGVGFYFMLIFVLISYLSGPLTLGFLIMYIIITVAMVFGFLDDRAVNAWGEYIKGFIDIGTAVFGGIVFAYFFGHDFLIGLTGNSFTIPPVVYAILGAILITVSINATNATDGVDGLSGTLTILTIGTLMAARAIVAGISIPEMIPGAVMIAVLAAYLIFNFNPSKMLMGDAGSRGIGFFIAFYAMYLRLPFSYLILGLPFLIDGGLSILKITIGRLTKKKVIILKNVTTPIHDHLKKRMGFSVKKTWAVIVACAAVIDLIYLGLCALLNR